MILELDNSHKTCNNSGLAAKMLLHSCNTYLGLWWLLITLKLKAKIYHIDHLPLQPHPALCSPWSLCPSFIGLLLVSQTSHTLYDEAIV